jgi:hypothetical protein
MADAVFFARFPQGRATDVGRPKRQNSNDYLRAIQITKAPAIMRKMLQTIAKFLHNRPAERSISELPTTDCSVMVFQI